MAILNGFQLVTNIQLDVNRDNIFFIFLGEPSL